MFGIGDALKKAALGKAIERIPIMPKFFKWLFDPTAIGRKRLLFAVLITAAGALRGADAGLHAACEEGTFKGAPCSFDAGSAADYIDSGVEYAKEKTEDPKVEIVGFLFGLYVCIDGYRKDRRARAKKAAAATVLLLMLAASSAHAQTPLAPPTASYSFTSGSTTLWTSGPRKEYFTARFGLRIFTDRNIPLAADARDSLRARVTLTASQDAGAVAIGSPETFQSIVPEIEYRRTLRGALQASAIGNVAFSAEGSDRAPLDPRMFSLFVGIRGALSDGSWLFAGAGKAGPVGPEIALNVRAGRSVGRGEVDFEYILPLRADALRNKAWVLQLNTTYQVAGGDLK